MKVPLSSPIDSLRKVPVGLCETSVLPFVGLVIEPLKPLCLSPIFHIDHGIDFMFRDMGEPFVPLTNESLSCVVSSFNHNLGGLGFVSHKRVSPPKAKGYFLRSCALKILRLAFLLLMGVSFYLDLLLVTCLCWILVHLLLVLWSMFFHPNEILGNLEQRMPLSLLPNAYSFP